MVQGVKSTEPHGPLRRGIAEAGEQLGPGRGQVLCDLAVEAITLMVEMAERLRSDYRLTDPSAVPDRDLARKLNREQITKEQGVGTHKEL